MKFLSVLSCVSFLSACSSVKVDRDGVNVEAKNEKEDFSYEYDINGCKTGKQTFSSKEDYCAGLLDEDRNHGCAKDVRLKTHKNECG